jgi:16S rRNA (uracil1498-N3)-methyltransferase
VTSLRDRADAAAQVLVGDLDDVALDEPDVHHLFRVLRLRAGEAVVAFDGAGGWRRCTVAGGGLEADGAVIHEAAPSPALTVWLPALKGERSEWAVQKLTELGVDEIGLLRCARGTVRLDEAGAARVLARWGRVVREAACQSRRTWLPRLLGPLDPAAAHASGARLCELDGSGDARTVHALAVGPEGGWSPDERPDDDEAVGLADAVLRTETAAVAAGAALVAARRTARHDASADAP